ncbi:glycosyl hydrolase [Brachybacterium avium]|uniref:alpha-L-fucosidase n=1 Tax=Brachybacterium avium TaxID=2017485 RepID=A0A220UED0_9MICO|nr:alpha-L-fucosidase [Brachybacterium avium]ASK66252.1 glycosyl hydrolase [Brachybacterium avium]
MSDVHPPREETDDFTPDGLEAAGAGGPVQDTGYVRPTDPRTLAALEHWQDLKFGLIVHWGLYTHLGQAGSWSLCRENLAPFMAMNEDFHGTEAEWNTHYYESRHTFSGQDYDPREWALAAREAGMKYLVLTTKHHDGFAMFDTKYSSLKSTAEDCGLGRDVVRETFDAFREQGLETGVYFSKPDWAHPSYWDKGREITDRWSNVDPETEPEHWRPFVEHTHRQVEELLTEYGEVNVLWLDGGWCRAPREPIAMDALADRARELQPDILVVDRTVHGRNENYRTPEQELPEVRLPYPWESCITFTRAWCSFAPEERTKPVGDAIANLITIIARGGNYLLGVGPDATGAMSSHIKRGLQAIGTWVAAHGSAIYGTRALEAEPRLQGAAAQEQWFTTGSDGALNLFFLPEDIRGLDRDHPARLLPAGELRISSAELPTGLLTARVLDGGAEVPVTRDGADAVLQLPAVPVRFAACVRIEGERS